MGARETLRDGGQIDLRGALPQGLCIIPADNIGRLQGQYQISAQQRAPLTRHLQQLSSVLVLAAHNSTVSSLRSFFNRSMPIWEGHSRDALGELCVALQVHCGNATEVGIAAVKFVTEVSVGFTACDFSRQLLEDIEQGCTKSRAKRPAIIQSLGRIILDEPNHRGVGKFLTNLRTLSKQNPAFASIKIDHSREFQDAVQLAGFSNPDEGFAEISRRRAYARASVPLKAISTIHKAKGLEFPHVVIAACDRPHFGDTKASRANLYVGLSRATGSLSLHISTKDPSPLFLT